MILGTAAYMSPEQARGYAVDKRTDIWAFGVILFELLTGKDLYGGRDTVTDTLAAVVLKEPDYTSLPADTPPRVRRLIERCLRKDPKLRLRDIGEARLLLEEPEPAVPAALPNAPRRAWLPWTIAVAATLAAAAAWFPFTRTEPLRPLVRMTVELDAQAALVPGGQGSIGQLAMSPDGRRIAVVLRVGDTTSRIYTRLLDQPKLNPLAGTENASHLFFSPDNQWIGFVAEQKLKKVSVDGGTAVTICEVQNARGASWADDGNIFVADAPRLLRVSSLGGTPIAVFNQAGTERASLWPQVLPGSQAVVFTQTTDSENDNSIVEVLSLKTGERKVLVRGGFSGRVITVSKRRAYLVYMHGYTLFAVPIDPSGLTLTGAAAPVLEDVGAGFRSGGNFAFSDTGSFVYRSASEASAVVKVSLFDRAGKTAPLLSRPGRYGTLRFSPDGKRLAFSQSNGAGSDIWVKDLDRETPMRISFLKGLSTYPVWTPDGNAIVFRSQSQSQTESGLYWTRADGSSEAQRVMDDQLIPWPESFSPDGGRLAIEAKGAAQSWDLYTARVEGDSAHPKLGALEPFLSTPFNENLARFSPDGRWMAYLSNQSGKAEVYVRPFPGPGGLWQVSDGGGVEPVWSKDGRELFYLAPRRQLMSVSIAGSQDSIRVGKPRQWPGVEPQPGSSAGNDFDIAPDGKHIAAIVQEAEERAKPITHLTFLQNFSDELQRKTVR